MTITDRHTDHEFVHAAFAYHSDDEYVDGLTAFLAEPLASGAPIGVMVPTDRIQLLADTLLGRAPNVELMAMDRIGRNPGRIISAWSDFVERHDRHQTVWAVGEPVWHGRTDAEIAECQIHEHLLNDAFAGASLHLLCPYDAAALPPEVVEAAATTHPYLDDGEVLTRSAVFTSEPGSSDDLEPAPDGITYQPVRFGSTGAIRRSVEQYATSAGLSEGRVADLVLAVSEIAANSIEYGGGGTLTMWCDGTTVVCQLEDSGHLADPMTGRRRPMPSAARGRGIWMAHQLCDLVQIRTGDSGTTVRLSIATRT